MINRLRQRGITVIGAVMLLILIFFAGLIGMRVVPIYIQYYQVKQILAAVKNEIRSLDRIEVSDVNRRISRRFDIDYVGVVKARDIKVRRRAGKLVALLKYEDRRNLLYNLDIVGNFNETVQLYPP